MDDRIMATIRTQLTVALLAVGQLARDPARSERPHLIHHATNALESIREDIARIDALLAKLEDREAIAADPLRFQPFHRKAKDAG
jgi:hypothetical protein